MFRSLLHGIAGNAVVRRLADASFGAFARRRCREIDALPIAATQERTLLRLVRRAERTRFGRRHDFARIRSVDDYQERVPLRYYDDFWNDWWKTDFPVLRDATWPGTIPYFALSSGTTTGITKHIPFSREMLRSNRKAAFTTLAFFANAHPDASLFSGTLFFLGGSTTLQPLDRRGHILAGDLSGIAAREAPSFLRAYAYPPLEVGTLGDWERKLTILAEQSMRLPISGISGMPSWLLVLFDRLLRLSGKDCIADLWPRLRLLIHGGTSFEPYRTLFRQVIGSDRVRFLETYPASEGFVAAQDPRHDLLRLIPDHDLFFEFVPVDELGADRPTRHLAADVVPGVQYAVALTTCAGLWSYVVGDTVCFERRDPPLLRFTGRTKHFLSAFGEHLIAEEVERAVALTADATSSAIADYHVGPLFSETAAEAGRHHFLVEFVRPPQDLDAFATLLDGNLRAINKDYDSHRKNDLTIRLPLVEQLPQGFFASWMKSRGKLGGQNKVPRMDNSGKLTSELRSRFASESVRANGPTG